jgi:hypothetical protein
MTYTEFWARTKAMHYVRKWHDSAMRWGQSESALPR